MVCRHNFFYKYFCSILLIFFLSISNFLRSLSVLVMDTILAIEKFVLFWIFILHLAFILMKILLSLHFYLGIVFD